ncbi:MAG: hypothetical protein U1G05_01835 [Kiritimatiellia bacterium]
MAAGACAFFLLAGCATLSGRHAPPEGDPAELDRPLVLPLAQTNLAAALASFSAGLLAEADLAGDEALRHYLDAIAKEPAQPEPYQQAVRRLVILNRPDQASKLLDRAAASMPGNPDPLRWKAVMLHETKRHDEALAAWKILLEKFPDREEFPLEAARALFQCDHDEDAAGLLEPRLEKFGHPVEYYRYLIDLYPRAARKAPDPAAYEQAKLAIVEDAARRFPLEDPFLAQAARLRIRTGDLKTALRHLEAIEDRRPDDPGVKALPDRGHPAGVWRSGDSGPARASWKPLAEDPASSSRVSMYLGPAARGPGQPRRGCPLV